MGVRYCRQDSLRPRRNILSSAFPSARVRLASVLFALVIIGGCGGDDAQTVGLQLPDFTQLVERAEPAVVNISVVPSNKPAVRSDRSSPGDAPDSPGDSDGGSPSDQFQDWFHRFFGPDQDPDAPPPGAIPHGSLGSGFIISSDGYILTNNHVISEKGQIIVKLGDKRQLVAKRVGGDAYSDIALLKVDAKGLPTVKIGDVNALKVGAWVVAIGSPFGFETSVTAGIVSAKSRSLSGDQYVPFLQTDVAINPGNSGGPLFNLKGEVVGVNSQIYSRTGGYQGVSFAIPIDVAMNAVKQLRENGKVQRGWLGVQIQEVDRELAKSFGMERPEGALVAQVLDKSPAQAAGMAAGDVIVEFNGEQVDSAAALPPIVGRTPIGKSVAVVVLRDGKQKKLNVKIGKLDEDRRVASTGTGPNEAQGNKVKKLGMTLSDLSKAEREKLKVEHGVRVEKVDSGPARTAGLQAGDVIVAVGSKSVTNAKALRKQLEKAKKPVALLIRRDGNPLFLALDPSP